MCPSFLGLALIVAVKGRVTEPLNLYEIAGLQYFGKIVHGVPSCPSRCVSGLSRPASRCDTRPPVSEGARAWNS